MNLVEIEVRVTKNENFDTAISGIAAAFSNLTLIAAGISIAAPLAAAALAVGAFAAVAIPNLGAVKKSLVPLKDEFITFAKGFRPLVLEVTKFAASTAEALLPALKQLVPAGAKVIEGVLRPMKRLFESDFFKGFIRQMSDLATQIGPVLGGVLVHITKKLMALLEAVGPSGVTLFRNFGTAIANLVGDITPATAALAKFLAKITKTKTESLLLEAGLITLGLRFAGLKGPIGLAIAALLSILAIEPHLLKTNSFFAHLISGWNSIISTGTKIILRTIEGFVLAVLDVFSAIPHIIADIPLIGNKMRPLADAFDNAYKHVKSFFDGTVKDIGEYDKAFAKSPKEFRLQGDIRDLSSKLDTAKKRLNDPDLTKTRRAQIQANIANLQARLAVAIAQLRALQGYTVTTYVQTIPIGGGRYIHSEHGGAVPGYAGGGSVGGSRTIMVGEHGRELIRVPVGSSVMSNPDTERALSRGGGGAQKITIEFVRSSSMTGLDDMFWTWLQRSVRIKGGDPAMFIKKVAFQ